MGNMIGILSTVILVSTLATLIFAVGAYVMARRRRSDIEAGSGDTEDIPERTEPLRQAPESAGEPTASPLAPPAKPSPPVQPTGATGNDTKPVFRRLTTQGEPSVDSADLMEKKPGWEWE